MRIMGLDYGSRTVGVAVSDALGLTAQAVETVTREEENKLRKTLRRIEELAGAYEVDRIVLGCPKNMNNTQGDRGERTGVFREMLDRRRILRVIPWNGGRQTVAAERILMGSGVRRENRKQVIDQGAAVMLLPGYLDWLSRGGE